MRILGIETSCDETSISILEFNQNQCKILVNLIYSQIAIHQPYGGVVPNLAKREHQKKLVPLFKLALKQTNLLKNKKIKSSEAIITIKMVIKIINFFLFVFFINHFYFNNFFKKRKKKNKKIKKSKWKFKMNYYNFF